ncbi:MAG: hypothetical protein K0S04_1865 [Herbinix sp.]|jgi:putative exporter of polyketide antibiotics|nr:hypothetical protein [Herbinix sp.]
MKKVTIISAVITVLLLMSTMVCGLWLRANNISDPGSFDFHVNCGIASFVFSVITLCLAIITLSRRKKRG